MFRYTLNTPAFLQQREALILKKVLRDFPEPDQWTLLYKSTTHPKVPENPKKYVRINMKIAGIVFEEDHEIKGTRLTWLM